KVLSTVVAAVLKMMSIHPFLGPVPTSGARPVVTLHHDFPDAFPFGLWWPIRIPQARVRDPRSQQDCPRLALGDPRPVRGSGSSCGRSGNGPVPAGPGRGRRQPLTDGLSRRGQPHGRRERITGGVLAAG